MANEIAQGTPFGVNGRTALATAKGSGATAGVMYLATDEDTIVVNGREFGTTRKATAETAGLMSAADKKNVDALVGAGSKLEFSAGNVLSGQALTFTAKSTAYNDVDDGKSFTFALVSGSTTLTASTADGTLQSDSDATKETYAATTKTGAISVSSTAPANITIKVKVTKSIGGTAFTKEASALVCPPVYVGALSGVSDVSGLTALGSVKTTYTGSLTMPATTSAAKYLVVGFPSAWLGDKTPTFVYGGAPAGQTLLSSPTGAKSGYSYYQIGGQHNAGSSKTFTVS